MGKEHVFKAFKREAIDRTPWVPFVGCHGGKLIISPLKEPLEEQKALLSMPQGPLSDSPEKRSNPLMSLLPALLFLFLLYFRKRRTP